MAESLGSAEDYGWFKPADLQLLLEAVQRLPNPESIILVGGQALDAWILSFRIPIPPHEGDYLTADADFLGGKVEAQIIADYLQGTSRVPNMDDHTVNTALIEFTGSDGKTLQIDMLAGVLGLSNEDARKLAVPMEIIPGSPSVLILHPLLVLRSRCANLEILSVKRTNNGITQARVACAVAKKYVEACLSEPTRRREALDAAKMIADLAKSGAGLFVWTNWKIDVMTVIEPTRMPGQFNRSWTHDIAEVHRRRKIAERAAAFQAERKSRLRDST